MSEDWQKAMRQRIKTVPGWDVETSLPVGIPRHWLSLSQEDYLMCQRNKDGVPLDPLLAQALPSPQESLATKDEAVDPLGESRHRILPRVVHQYPSRLLVRATGECPLFCRYCFRRSLLKDQRSWLDRKSISSISSYISAHPEIREVLVSGGDPLTVSDDRLEELFTAIRRAGSAIVIRLCTRTPVCLPSRVTPGLVDLLHRSKPLKLILHINHPREISQEFILGLEAMQNAGLPIRSQSVLLKGINDRAETLAELFSSLSRLGVEPYYLFQGDLAAGTSHFRVPLSKGLELYRQLRQRLSGLELPRYALDAPEGGGKLYLPESVIGLEGKTWILEGPDGRRHRYPEET
ncbi:MAG: lysine 2 3-aminomutase YodO family protein [Spirochaetes bacterium]|nr:MAG: lysine 2 3-aminomutase YodO family protein [Spirochaetota bacterium]